MLWRRVIIRINHLKLASFERYPIFYIEIIEVYRKDMEGNKE